MLLVPVFTSALRAVGRASGVYHLGWSEAKVGKIPQFSLQKVGKIPHCVV